MLGPVEAYNEGYLAGMAAGNLQYRILKTTLQNALNDIDDLSNYERLEHTNAIRAKFAIA
jgi:hypothetical protein